MNTKIYKPIQNEAYPYIIILVFTLFLMFASISKLGSSAIYTLLFIILIIINGGMFVIIYGMVSAYIKIDNEKIEYFYKFNKIIINWEEILNISYAYPNKKVYANRGKLYEIKIISIVSKNNDNITFHYIYGNPIQSVKNINTPYINQPSLYKGMWLTSKDSIELLTFAKNQVK